MNFDLQKLKLKTYFLNISRLELKAENKRLQRELRGNDSKHSKRDSPEKDNEDQESDVIKQYKAEKAM